MIKLKDILKEGKETISDAHIGHIQAMLKRGFENEARWALAGGVGANKLEQAYRYVEKIDQSVKARVKILSQNVISFSSSFINRSVTSTKQIIVSKTISGSAGSKS